MGCFYLHHIFKFTKKVFLSFLICTKSRILILYAILISYIVRLRQGGIFHMGKDVMFSYDTTYTQNREISWLRFNRRVLEEAADDRVPLLERLKFISIFTSNLDEFFMVRVGSLFDLSLMSPKEQDNRTGETASQQLNAIFDVIPGLVQMKNSIFQTVTAELAAKGICDLSDNLSDAEEKKYVSQYFKNFIQPVLSAQVIDAHHPFPHLVNKALYVESTG